MFVATVELRIAPAHVADFLPVMDQQARNSRDLEDGCLQFDVCVDPDDPARVFLYEVYVDEAAFEAHLKSAHFLDFDRRARPWVRERRITRWRRRPE